MDMQNYTTPFAIDGDREDFSIDTDPEGKVSLRRGWTELYQLRPEEGGLFILRKVFNQMMKLVSTDTVTWKTQSFPNWIGDKGDGLPYAYPKNAIVKHTNGNIYVSLVNNNTQVPTGANWKLFDITALDNAVKLSGNQTIAGVKTFSSSPIVPTPVSTDKSNQVATTAFVQRNFNVIGAVNDVDFDTITDAGLYERVVQGIAPNGMGGNDYYYIVVYKAINETLVQLAYPYSTGAQNKKVWTRTKYLSTWGDWNLISGEAVSQVTTLSNPTKNVGATWQKLGFSTEQISTASNVCKYNTGTGNFQVLNKGTYELTAQIYPSPAQNTNAKISLYLGLFDLGSDGTGDTLIAVVNEEFPSGQHPSVLINRVVEVTTPTRYFTFKWYFLDGGSVTPDMTLQTSSIYTYANIKKI